MSRRAIYIVILLALISLTGVIITQIYWVRNAYNLQEKEFNDRAIIAMNAVVERILTINKDSAFVEPVKQLSNNYFVANINDTLHPFLLETLLKEEFQHSNLNEDFEYGIYDCFNDSIVFGGKVRFDKPGTSEKPVEISQQKRFEDDGHYFGVYFPQKRNMILNQMDFWIFSSFMILLVVLFFAYAMSTILKQKRLSEVKTDFINNMTHELKTPISTISLSSEVLLKPDIVESPDRLQQYAKIIQNENLRLKSQVDRVLQVATLNPGQLKLKEKELDVSSIINKAVETFKVTASEKGGVISTDLKADNHSIKGDEVHITNIFYNLLDNACKYNDKVPEISISTENENGRLKIRVKDNGLGISKEHTKSVFEKFFRVPTGNLHDVKGFGLGLYYVKTVIEAHGGKIWVNSSPGEGSEFC